jgi:hypothetical protein
MAKKKVLLKKLPAVRLAVKQLGVEAPVAEVRKLVKDKYNIDLTDAVAQNYVSIGRRELRDGNGKAAKVKGRPKAAPAPMPAPTPAPVFATPKAMGNGVAIEQVIGAVTTLKGLVGTLGKDNLFKLVEAL